jgi:capsular exopolysaccharide synthesis family protein
MHKKNSSTLYKSIPLSEGITSERDWFFLLLRKKAPHIILSLLLSFVIAYVFNQYTVPVYKAQGLYLIHDENTIDNQRFLGYAMGNQLNAIENKRNWLQSFYMARETIKAMNHKVFYYNKSRFRSDRVDAEAIPFVIYPDTTVEQITGNRFDIYCYGNGTYRLVFDAANFTTYHYQTETSKAYDDIPLQFDTVLTCGTLFQSPYFRFTIRSNPGYPEFQKGWYQFQMNDFNLLANRYRWVAIEPVKQDATLMKLELRSQNPDFIMAYLNSLMKVSLQKETERKSRSLNQSVFFINDQLGSLTDSLKKAQQALINFQKKNIAVYSKSPPKHWLEKHSELLELKAKLLLQQKELSHLDSLIAHNDYLHHQTIAIPARASDGTWFFNARLQAYLQLLYAHKNIQAFGAGKESAEIRKTNYQIEQTLKLIARQTTYFSGQIQNKIAFIDRQLEETDKKICRYPFQNQKFLNIKRHYDLLNYQYTMLLKYRLDHLITKASVTPDSEIIDLASEATLEKVYPKIWLNYLLAIILGIAIPLGYFYLRAYFDNKVKTESDLRLRIPHIKILGRLFHNDKATNLVTVNHPLSIITESVRSVRSRIDLLMQAHRHQVILVSSVMPGEGKTFTSINLALSFASKGKRTLLAGFDIRKPKIYDDFGVKNTFGLTNYLSNQQTLDPLIQPSGYDYLELLMSGPIPTNPAELIAADETKVLFDNLRKRYDFIIIDTPPVGLVTDALLLVKHSDIQIFVARQNYTDKNRFAEVMNNIEEAVELPYPFIVVNDVRPDIKEGYGYYSDDADIRRQKLWYRIYNG